MKTIYSLFAITILAACSSSPTSDGQKLGKKECAFYDALKNSDEQKMKKLQEEFTNMEREFKSKYTSEADRNALVQAQIQEKKKCE